MPQWSDIHKKYQNPLEILKQPRLNKAAFCLTQVDLHLQLKHVPHDDFHVLSQILTKNSQPDHSAEN